METNTIDFKNLGRHGQLTARMAHEVGPFWEELGCYILYDHDPSGGKIVSWFGKSPYGRNTQLSHIDIAIIEKNSERVLALIEIEETTDKPKTLLGDVFGVLMGDGVSYGNEHPLIVDDHTALFVFGFVTETSRFSHEGRILHLADRVNRINFSEKAGNCLIKTIKIKAFSSDRELIENLTTGIVSSVEK